MHAWTFTPSFIIALILAWRSLSAASSRADGPQTMSRTSPNHLFVAAACVYIKHTRCATSGSALLHTTARREAPGLGPEAGSVPFARIEATQAISTIEPASKNSCFPRMERAPYKCGIILSLGSRPEKRLEAVKARFERAFFLLKSGHHDPTLDR